MKTMKTVTIGGTTYEIVDEQARAGASKAVKTINGASPDSKGNIDTYAPTDEQVNAWLDAHPEATTTVQNGAITKVKLSAELQEQIDTVVTPEIYGAVGDGVTDDSAAFINALMTGKRVVCDPQKTYYFDKPVDVRTLTKGHLDGNNAWFINFHIYININDDFNDWRNAYNPGRFIIENMNLGAWDGYGKIPYGWETPSITTGCPVVVRNVVTRYPYLLATVDRYIDYIQVDSCGITGGLEVFGADELTLDAICCLNRNGEYCRFDPTLTPNSSGDAWRITQCTEFSRADSDYRMLRIVTRGQTLVESCVQCTFDVCQYAKPVFIACHWEAKGAVHFTNNVLVTASFINCYFYDNYVLNNNASTRYESCFFATAYDATSDDNTLADVTGGVSLYDLKCAIADCRFSGGSIVDTQTLKHNKTAPKKTYNWSAAGGYRKKLAEMAVTASTTTRRGLWFPATGDYTYNIYLRATSLPDVAIDSDERVITIDSVKTGLQLPIEFVSGGFSVVVYRTNPDGTIVETEYYADPNYSDAASTYAKFWFEDYGSYANFAIEGSGRKELFTPWIVVDKLPPFTVNEVLYEANGVLVTTDGSEFDAAGTGLVQAPKLISDVVIASEFALYKNYVTPQMYGAKGNGTTDDTAAIQAAIDSGKVVYFPKATYLIGSTIEITGKSNWAMYANDAIIQYTGPDYAFQLSKVRSADLYFNTITATNGGCISLVSTSGDMWSQYININFSTLSAVTNCIYGYATNGYIAATNIRGGRFTSGENGLNIEVNGGYCNGWKLNDCTLHGVETGAYLNAVSGSIVGFDMFQFVNHAGKTVLKTSGDVQNVLLVGAQSIKAAQLELSSNTKGKIIAPLVTAGGGGAASEAVIVGGYILLQSNNGDWNYINVVSSFGETLDLRTEDPFANYYSFMAFRGTVTSIYLPEHYGRAHGLNKFILRFNEDNGDELTIYDHAGNVIFNNTASLGWSELEFRWAKEVGWSVYKLSKQNLTTS